MPSETYLFANKPKPAPKQPHSDAQKLLDWLMHWSKPKIRLNEICVWGPRSIRDREIAINSAQTLVDCGWLAAIQARRRDMIEWRIIRKPVAHPTIATKPAK